MKFKKIQDKKAQTYLTKKTFNIVLGIICLLLLLFLSGKLYGATKAKSDLQKAEYTLDEIVETIEVVWEGGKSRSYLVLYPEKWYLRNPGKTFTHAGCDREDRNWETCLCVCKGDSFEGCDDVKKKGVCKEVRYEIDFVERKQSFSIDKYYSIRFKPIPFEIVVSKNDNIIEISESVEGFFELENFLNLENKKFKEENITNVKELILAYTGGDVWENEKKEELEKVVNSFLQKRIEEKGFGGIIKIDDGNAGSSLDETNRELIYIKNLRQPSGSSLFGLLDILGESVTIKVKEGVYVTFYPEVGVK